MPTQTIITTANGQALQVNTTLAKVFLWNRRSQAGQITNGGGAPVSYPEGTVMGRIASTGKLVPFTSAAADGSGIPIGVLIDSYTVGAGLSQNVFICDDGDVAAEQLKFQGADTLETVVALRRVKDHLKSAGVKVIYSTEMTAHDSSL